MDQPTCFNETNGTRLKVNTFVLCLWCFGCMHANHAYKAAVFSGSHFQEKTEYPLNTHEMIKSSWEKHTSRDYNIGDQKSSSCMLHFMSADLNNKTSYLKEITKDVICNVMYDVDKMYFLNEWSLNDFNSNNYYSKMTNIQSSDCSYILGD